MPNIDHFAFLDADAYEAVLGHCQRSLLSPYQHPAFLRSRVLWNGRAIAACYEKQLGYKTAAIFEWRNDMWIAHEGPGIGNEPQQLVNAFHIATGKYTRMSVKIAPSDCSNLTRLESAYATRVLYLRNSLDSLERGFSPACHRAIRRFKASPLCATEIGSDSSDHTIARMSDIFSRAETRDHLPLDEFTNLMFCYIRCGAGVAVIITLHDEILAAGLMLRSGVTANLRYLTTRRNLPFDVNHHRPGNGLVWACIDLAQKSGIHEFDLSGISVDSLDNKPNSIDRFKEGFGGVVVTYAHLNAP